MYEQLFEGNEEAGYAFKILHHQSVFLTGSAGTGKSTFIEWAKTISDGDCLIMAPTGLTARNINGRTIHSVFHVPPSGKILPTNFSNLFDPKRFHYWQKDELRFTDLIIIDEISMINSATMDFIDYMLRNICSSEKSFAGKKLLLIGDPFQLPPVIDNEYKDSLRKHYGGEFFFYSHAFKKLNPIKIELKKVYRQTDVQFCNLLNDLRQNKNIAKSFNKLNNTCYKYFKENLKEEDKPPIFLTFTNKEAQSINDGKLEILPFETYAFDAIQKGIFDQKSCLAEKILKVKVGARIMLIKNHKCDYVNGTLGIVKAIDTKVITVEDDLGNEFKIKKVKWQNKESGFKNPLSGAKEKDKIIGEFMQFPIRLAWAITVHKSQGLTFDKIFLSNNFPPFATAQTYVALSRCRTIEGISLFRPLHADYFKVDSRVVAFYQKLTSKNEIEYLVNEIYDGDFFRMLPITFNSEEAQQIALENKVNLLDNGFKGGFEAWIRRMIDSGLLVEDGLNKYKKIDKNYSEIEIQLDKAREAL